MKATGRHWVALDEATFRMGNGRGDGYPDDGELPVRNVTVGPFVDRPRRW